MNMNSMHMYTYPDWSLAMGGGCPVLSLLGAFPCRHILTKGPRICTERVTSEEYDEFSFVEFYVKYYAREARARSIPGRGRRPGARPALRMYIYRSARYLYI